jgi:flavin reductase (DIM6/NTAB) family NADH-FMN oxidoreductase RutF
MPIDPIQFRNALGTFATGVCIIGATPPDELPFAMTVNSLASVSLDPALLLWSLQNDSDCYPAFEKIDTFSVNILASGQQSLSNAYAKKGEHVLAPDDFSIGPAGTPVIRGAVTSFECKIWARYPGGDHIILVGEVMEMETGSNEQPLLFHKGQYSAIA